jgi:hypothetical protein
MVFKYKYLEGSKDNDFSMYFMYPTYSDSKKKKCILILVVASCNYQFSFFMSIEQKCCMCLNAVTSRFLSVFS